MEKVLAGGEWDLKARTNGETLATETDFSDDGKTIKHKFELLTLADGKSTKKTDFGNDNTPDSVTFNFIDENGRSHKPFF